MSRLSSFMRLVKLWLLKIRNCFEYSCLDFNGMVNRLVDLTNMNVDALRVDTNTWGDQFRNAMNVNGGDLESATTMDYFMHFCTFAWKVRNITISVPGSFGKTQIIFK